MCFLRNPSGRRLNSKAVHKISVLFEARPEVSFSINKMEKKLFFQDEKKREKIVC